LEGIRRLLPERGKPMVPLKMIVLVNREGGVEGEGEMELENMKWSE
jgi:hypothetical protein